MSPSGFVDVVDSESKKQRNIVQHCFLFGRYLFSRMCFVCLSECFQLHDPGLVAYSPGDDLSGMFAVIGFDDCPSTMSAIVAAPLEVMEIACRVDLFDDCITIAGIVR